MMEASEQAILNNAVDQIASRVAAALRADLADLARAAITAAPAGSPMSVEQVAQRLGVARSTVYAHWREWGGYKLGPGAKAPIRFDPARLATQVVAERDSHALTPTGSGARRRPTRPALLTDAPRLVEPHDEVA